MSGYNKLIYLFFFFSSRRRHTSWPRDWSSDVCSSDLEDALLEAAVGQLQAGDDVADGVDAGQVGLQGLGVGEHEAAIHQIGRASCRGRVEECTVNGARGNRTRY